MCIRDRYIRDEKRAMTVQYHITLAHCLAVNEFRLAQKAWELCEGAKIGLINCFAPPYTKENPSAEDLEAVRMEDGIHNRWWLDVVSKGELPQDVVDTLEEYGIAPYIRPGDKEIISLGKVDWLGFNYYQPARVQAPANKFDEEGLSLIHILVGYKLLIVKPADDYNNGKNIVAIDRVGAGIHTEVIVTTGSSARLGLNKGVPADAAIVGIVD